MTDADMVIAAAAVIYVATVLVEDWREWNKPNREPDTYIDELRERYVSGELTIEEFETRVELTLDDDARELRTSLEAINGIGPETSAVIAQEFGTVDAIANADRDALEDVHGVGEKTAEQIREKF